MSRKLILALVAVLIVIGVIIWMFRSGQPREPTVARETVTLGYAKEVAFLPLIALKKGYFTDAGVDVRFREYPTAKLSFRGMLGGEVDVGMTAPAFAFASFEHTDIRIFCSFATIYRLFEIIARKDRGILTPSDLRGKRVATQQRSAQHLFLDSFLAFHALSDKEIQLSFLPSKDLPGALARGELDAIASTHSFVVKAQQLLGDDVVIFSEREASSVEMILVAFDCFIEAKPDAIKRMLRALIRAEEFAKKHRDEAITLLAQELGIEDSELAERWSKIDLRVSLDQGLLYRQESAARWAIRRKLTEKTEVPNYLNYVYLDALEEIKPEAVTIIH